MGMDGDVDGDGDGDGWGWDGDGDGMGMDGDVDGDGDGDGDEWGWDGDGDGDGDGWVNENTKIKHLIRSTRGFRNMPYNFPIFSVWRKGEAELFREPCLPTA